MGINIITEFQVKRVREGEVMDLLRRLFPESKQLAGHISEEISIL
jgi:hypothetical protein